MCILTGLYSPCILFTHPWLQPTAHLPLIVAPTDCDSCVMTLLNDLANMGNELHLVKSQLHGLSASTSSLEQMKHLETQIKDLRVSTPCTQHNARPRIALWWIDAACMSTPQAGDGEMLTLFKAQGSFLPLIQMETRFLLLESTSKHTKLILQSEHSLLTACFWADFSSRALS